MSLSGAAKGAAGGAIAGSVIPGAGTAIGAGLGFLAGLFETDPSKQRDQQVQAGMAYLNAARRDAITTGMDRLSAMIAKSRMSATRAAGRRALGMGLGAGAAETMIAPAVSQVETAGGQMVNSFMDSTDRMYNQAEANLQMGAVGAPLEPGLTDYLLPAATAYATNKLNQDYIETLRNMAPPAANTSEAPADTAISPSRSPGLAGEFTVTGEAPPANTLGLGAFTTPEAPRMRTPKMFSSGSYFGQF